MNRKDRRRTARTERKSGVAVAGSTHGQAAAAAGLLTTAQALHNEGRFSEAAELCRRILAGDGHNADALLILGSASANLGQSAAARTYIDQSIAYRPADPRAWLVLASHLIGIGDAGGALAACQKALEIAPALPAAHATLGNIMASERRFELAELAFRRTLELNPGFPDAEVNLGSALFYQGKLEDAVAAQRRALLRHPGHPYAFKNLAASLRALGKFEEALEAYRQATALAPHLAEAHRDEALLLLLLGRFREGWSKYEWRWRAPTIGADPIPGPRWQGETIAARTILLQAEQGFGDTLQFLRYVPMVAARGGKVVLRLPSSLTGLRGNAMSAASRVVSLDEPLPQYDRHAPLLSLPNIFATTLDTIPNPGRYLDPPPHQVEHWRRQIGAFRGIRVGLMWAGNPTHENDHYRSMRFADLLPLFAVEPVRFYSLQVGDRGMDVRLGNSRVIDLSASLTDFGVTAGAIDALDLVITVDTAVAHLAGALGRPVWLLLPHIPDWRWLLGRDDSPWYPAMRLFRQQARGDWAGVIDDVRRELERLVRRDR